VLTAFELKPGAPRHAHHDGGTVVETDPAESYPTPCEHARACAVAL
jgi:hypothetical protein